MNRSSTSFVFASVLAVAALVGLAWAANVEEELKKLETDRAAAAAKGNARKANVRRLHVHQLVRPNVGQVANGKQLQNRPNQAHL